MLDHSSRRASADAAPSCTPLPSPADDSRQRRAIEYLERFEYPVELRTLATHVAAAERNLPAETVGDDARERVAIRLHHVDVPELVADGYIDYDPESRMAVSVGAENERGRYAEGWGQRSSGPT